MRSAPPEAAVRRFVEDFEALGGDVDDGCLLAVSGGPDSLALLLLAHEGLNSIHAITVDHGLRPQSASEAQFVAKLCGELGVAHEILLVDEAPTGNVSDWARRVRYEAMLEWLAADPFEARHIITAHHADDQLETMVMRINRGTGLSGLAAVRGRLNEFTRPLLGWRKAELAALVRTCGIEAVDDPSNRDDRYDRARLRKALSTADWLDPVAASRTAAALAQANEALDWAASDYFLARAKVKAGGIVLDPKGLPAELIRRLILRCLRDLGGERAPRGHDLQRLTETLQAGKIGTLGGVRAAGGALWHFSPAPPRRAN